jgi:hypothetical protein
VRAGIESALIALCACGNPKPASPLAGMDVSMSTVEWRVKPGDAGRIDVALVVDGQVNKLGELDGTPEECAIRRAEATATELVCSGGDFSAELVEHELVVRDAARELKRIPVGPSVAITVAPYALPQAQPANDAR